jgi:hypothetical protein
VKAQLERILISQIFVSAHRSQLFLRYIVQHEIAHPSEQIKEYSIALHVFARDSYDPAVNNTVRVEAARLRSRLHEYYAGEGRADPLLIEVPKGSYRALIRVRESDREIVTHRAPVPLQSPAVSPFPASAPRLLRHLWAVPLAFLIGAFIGHRASR